MKSGLFWTKFPTLTTLSKNHFPFAKIQKKVKENGFSRLKKTNLQIMNSTPLFMNTMLAEGFTLHKV